MTDALFRGETVFDPPFTQIWRQQGRTLNSTSWMAGVMRLVDMRGGGVPVVMRTERADFGPCRMRYGNQGEGSRFG